jgi:hypothetical protein
MSRIENLLKKIDERLDRIEDRLSHVERNTNRMVEHIGFVDGVYATLRKPLTYLTRYVSGDDATALPSSSSTSSSTSTPVAIEDRKP